MKPIGTGNLAIKPERDLPMERFSEKRLELVRFRQTRSVALRLRLPVAPFSAAQAEGKTVQMATILRTFRTLCQKHTFMVVEGVGGIYVPITQSLNLLDLINKIRLPVIVVGRSGVGESITPC